MFLKRIEIKGFKSFANKTNIDILPGITGIVGPNGSGKSNISDSIKWVLGEQSPKVLRGSKMEDVIFAGTNNKKPLSMAEVSIILDNKDKDLAIDFTDVKITRRVYKSGENQYLINGNQCRLKDIRELFMDTGIGKEGYSIIGQGKIEEILNSKPEDRRLIIEEAVGIVKYRFRKEEAEKKLKKTTDSINRVNDIIKEINNQLIPMKKDKEKAEEFKKAYNKLKTMEIAQILDKYLYNTSKIEGFNKEEESLEQKIIDISEKKEEKHLEINHISGYIGQIKEDIKSTEDKIFQNNNFVTNLNGEFKLTDNKISNNNNRIDDLNNNILDLNSQKENIQKEINSIKLSIKENKEELNNVREKKDSLNKDLMEKKNNLSLEEEGIKKLEEDIQNTNNTINDLKLEEKKLFTNILSLEKQIRQNEDSIKDINNRIKSCVTLIEEKRQSQLKILRNTKEIESEILEKDNLISSKKNELKIVDEYLLKLREEYYKKKYKLDNLITNEENNEGLYLPVKKLLQYINTKKISNCHGIIADLIKVNKGYENAIEVALGGILQNFVVVSPRDGKELINIAKTNKFGRITALPLNTIREKNILRNDLIKIQEFKDTYQAVDLVNYNNIYEPLAKNLLSRIIVTKDIDMAIDISKKLNYNYKIVTISGEIINAGGAMTGGSFSKSHGILSRKSDIEDLRVELKKLSDIIEFKNREREDLKEKIKYNEDIKVNLNNKKRNLDDDLIKINESIKALNEKEDYMKNQVDMILKDSEEKLKDIDIYKEDRIRNNNEIKSNEKILYNNKHELEKILELISLDNNNINELESKLQSYLLEFNNINSKIDSLTEKFNYNKNNIANIDLNIDKYKENINDLNQQVNKFEKELNNIKDEIKDKEFKLESLKKTYLQLNELKEEEYIKLHEKTRIYENIEKDRESLKEKLNLIKIELTKYNIENNNLKNQLLEEYSLTIEDAKKHNIDLKNYDNKEIKILKKQIKDLGSINLNSISQYEELLERYNFLDTQMKDLNKSSSILKSVILNMEKSMADTFIRELNKIRAKFNEVFNSLFGGGKADLVLIDESNLLETGIEIMAKPPGKKLQSLSLLSGGERALTAISLLFAILLIKPSPFCVLDEIEAALDESNVYRFSEFLMELSKKTQFIVVTHRKGTMESADIIYGVTMEKSGVSNLLSLELNKNSKGEKDV